MDNKLGVVFEFIVGTMEALKDGKIDEVEAQQMLSTTLKGFSMFLSENPMDQAKADELSTEIVEGGAAMVEVFKHFKGE